MRRRAANERRLAEMGMISSHAEAPRCHRQGAAVHHTGRLGDLIKTGGGTNVTPGEVELALTECDGVLEAYVVGADDRESGTVVAAAVVPRGDAVLDGEQLRTHLRGRLSVQDGAVLCDNGGSFVERRRGDL